MNPNPGGIPAGWVLVALQLDRGSRRTSVRLLVCRESGPDLFEEIIIPVLARGRVHEMVRLPDDVRALLWQDAEVDGSQQPPLSVRSVGVLERVLRMAYRSLSTYFWLTPEERSRLGFSALRIISNLPAAYRLAGVARMHYRRMPYNEWIERFDAIGEKDVGAMRTRLEGHESLPHVHVLISAYGQGAQGVRDTLTSLRDQIYGSHSCVVIDVDGSTTTEPGIGYGAGAPRVVPRMMLEDWLSAFNAALEGEHLVLMLRAGDRLPAHALYWFASEAAARQDAMIFYADDDELDETGRRRNPRFKPGWSLAHFRATHYLGRAVAVRGRAVSAAGGVTPECCWSGNYDLLLRILDSGAQRDNATVIHIPAVLLHRFERPSAEMREGESRRGAVGETGPVRRQNVGKPSRHPVDAESLREIESVRAHLLRGGVGGEVSATWPGCRRIRFSLPAKPPLISIVVPTRDSVSLLRLCLQSVLNETSYPAYEIVVVDNQSRDPDALAFLAHIGTLPPVRVLRYDRAFNFSAINNFAAQQARGEVLCLLNNDTEVMTPDWLAEMVGHLLQPKVAVVGAKLYFPDGRVQHAGDTVGPGGCANHLHAYINHDDPGYCNRAVVAQELSAVTGACLVTWRELYLKLGGLDERWLPVAFNDVDYCLRARAAGYRVVWTPHAELIHHESVSRGSDTSLRRRIRARLEVMTMRRRWRSVMRNDPFYNPNLSYQYPDFSLSRAPRVRKPWRDD